MQPVKTVVLMYSVALKKEKKGVSNKEMLLIVLCIIMYYGIIQCFWSLIHIRDQKSASAAANLTILFMWLSSINININSDLHLHDN